MFHIVHFRQMAEAIANGVKQVDGAEAITRRVHETLSGETIEKMGAMDAQHAISHVPVCNVEALARVDAVIFGSLRASATAVAGDLHPGANVTAITE